MTAIAADSAQLRTLPFGGATPRNLPSAAPLESSEETRHGMSAVAATATSAGISTEAALDDVPHTISVSGGRTNGSSNDSSTPLPEPAVSST